MLISGDQGKQKKRQCEYKARCERFKKSLKLPGRSVRFHVTLTLILNKQNCLVVTSLLNINHIFTLMHYLKNISRCGRI